MWWGATGLPEQIDAADVALAREQALNAGLAPRPADEIARARRAGGDPLVAHDEGELRRVAAELMLTWSPGEEEEARSMLAPLLR
jgi:hypothetical protein